MKVSEIVGVPHNKQKIYNMIKTKHQIVSNMFGFPYILQQTLFYKSKIPKSQKKSREYTVLMVLICLITFCVCGEIT